MPIVRTETDDGDEVELEVGTGDIEFREEEDPTDLDGVQSEIDRIAGKTRKKARQTARENLKTDDDFWEEMAQRRGVELREDGSPKGASKGEVKELKKELAQAKEKAQKAEEYESEIEDIRDTRLENDLLQHADGVKSDLKDVFLNTAKSRFQYDEDDDDFVPVGDDGTPRYGQGVGDVVEEMRQERPSMFQDTEVDGGSDVEPGGSTGGKRTWTEEEHASADPVAMDEETFQDWKSAEAEGRIK